MFTGIFCLFDIKKAGCCLKITLIIQCNQVGWNFMREHSNPRHPQLEGGCLFPLLPLACNHMKTVQGVCCLEGNENI